MPPTMMIASPTNGKATEWSTFLAPGQRFRSDDGIEEYTISRLRRDDFGLLHVTLRSGTGRNLSAFAEQIETAIRTGDLQPLSAGGAITRC